MNDIKDSSKNNIKNPSNQEVDIMEYIRILWDRRMLLLKVVGIGAFIGLVIAFSTPRAYQTKVLLAPEFSGSSINQMTGITAMLGIGGIERNGNALTLGQAKDIVNSTPFMLELLESKVKTMNGSVDTITNYMKTQKSPWWNYILSLPGKAIGGMLSVFKKESGTKKELEDFQVSPIQAKQISMLRKAISVSIEKKERKVEIITTFQDPMVTAIMADSIMKQLQKYLTKYQTSKAQQDCDYLEMLYKERQTDYYKAQEIYANYVDKNKGIILQSASTERIRLENEMNLAFQIYSQVATQLQLAKAKVQEARPAFAVLEPAIAPLRPSGMGKSKILLIWIFLSVVIAGGWILFGEEYWKEFKEGMKR